MPPWFQIPPPPAMPDDALPLPIRAVIGKARALELWQELWTKGVQLGRDIGRAEGAVGTALMLIVLFLAVTSVKRSRGQS